MSDWWGHLTGAIIVVMMVTFICIWAWAWSGRHRRTFSRMAELPMDDMAAPTVSTKIATRKSGA
ncbi:CcoQ/FixQ family Cbb3-type cytochrome c oxidase assembly chaperone [Dyella sp. C11]|uniref:cbb3-type cytochrome oxidase subunit 3 n=1 Tax=Dyella sp. C11 TaxID=2126991 RepID=UPI000D641380|nr:CcoQ/FixQ family Cbb3-type cytochrome c oxidase assembly chaperone [Dyella sp. C11]